MLLGALSALSALVRLAWISNPRVLLFDENYYVNAARKMLSLAIPADEIYADSPPGLDPNFSHPPLGKLLISFGIRSLGDRPLGWRFASIIFGSYAILAIYWLARSIRMSPWASLGASSLMAADTMFFIHGRIGTLEIFVLTFMLVAVALYLNDEPLYAGAVIGVAACIKLVGLFVIPCLVALELFRLVRRKKASQGRGGTPRPEQWKGSLWRRLKPMAITSATAVVCFLGLLQLLDRRFTTFQNAIHHTYAMLSSMSNGRLDTSVVDLIQPQAKVEILDEQEPGAPSGGAVNQVTPPPKLPIGPVIQQKGQRLSLAPTSSPLKWLINQEPILYYRAPTFRGPVQSWSLFGRSTPDATAFRVLINPAIIALATPALAICGIKAWRRRDSELFLPVAWFVGTFGTFLMASLLRPGAPGYIYYMVVVMPAIYLAIARLFTMQKLRRFIPAYAVIAILCFVLNFPFKTWGGV